MSLLDYLSLCPGPLACDTESLPDGSTYCVTLSHTPGTGRLIYVNDEQPEAVYDTPALTEFRSWLESHPDTLLLFHNYLHDVSQFESLSLPITQFRDTMVMAYELCLGGGGDEEDTESKAGRGSLSLKVLAHRHLAMTMTSFKDTVYPHSLPHVKRYLEEAQALLSPAAKVKRCTCGCPQANHQPRGATQRPTGKCLTCGCTKCKLAKPGPQDDDTKRLGLLHRKVGTLLSSLKQKDIDPWKRIKEWHEWDLETLGMVVGPVPLPSVEYVPEPELLRYATADADGTLRLYLYLKDLHPWLYY